MIAIPPATHIIIVSLLTEGVVAVGVNPKFVDAFVNACIVAGIIEGVSEPLIFWERPIIFPEASTVAICAGAAWEGTAVITGLITGDSGEEELR